MPAVVKPLTKKASHESIEAGQGHDATSTWRVYPYNDEKKGVNKPRQFNNLYCIAIRNKTE
ncbi:hypothetical protein GCM10007158_15530 [Vreelandella hamiltonii]|uniref:Uncharacterized protein n=2 Tax=Halomonadaceae TaxID=28256 RepID=A0A8H9I0W6_9GAMM|nr:hypothetical protein GCM10007157_11150 [Halomonas hamiltonii]GGW55293.1 hypothetical protein GCM10007158_15530 [Halomonas johnsoniae]